MPSLHSLLLLDVHLVEYFLDAGVPTLLLGRFLWLEGITVVLKSISLRSGTCVSSSSSLRLSCASTLLFDGCRHTTFEHVCDRCGIWEASQCENSICADQFTVPAAFRSKRERY